MEDDELREELDKQCKYSYIIHREGRDIVGCKLTKGKNKQYPFLFLGEGEACVSTNIYLINLSPHTEIDIENMKDCEYRK